MYIKRSLSVLLVLSFLLAIIAGCSSAPQKTAPAASTAAGTAAAATKAEPAAAAPAKDSPKPYELSVAWWGGEARHKKTLAMIDAYMKKFPEAKVVSQYAAYSDYFTKLATQAASGNLPDVYLVQLMYIEEYASKGLMRPLKDLVDAKKIDVSKFTAGALSCSSYNGNLVGITFGDTAGGLAYNQSLIESVKYPLPKDQMSYSEYGTYLKGLAKALPQGFYASGLDAEFEVTIENYTRQHGLNGVLSKDGKALGYTKEVLTNYINFYYDLFKAGVNGPLEVLVENRGKQWGDSLAGKGKVAMWATNVNQGKIYQASVQDKIGMLRGIVADNSTHKNVEAAVPSTWAISGKTKKVDESAKFITTMVNDWELQKIYDMDIGVPGSTAIQENLVKGLDMNNKVDVLKKREIELMQNILSTIEPFPGRAPGYGAVINDLYKKIDEVLYGRMNVQQAVDAHFTTAQTLLK